MTKQHFIGIADAIRHHNRTAKEYNSGHAFTPDQLDTLADFFKGLSPAFKRQRWMGYIYGENGPSGGKVKVAA